MTEIIELVIWPVTLVIALLILRKPLGGLIELTRRVKYKDLEIEFRDELKAIEQELQGADAPTGDGSGRKVDLDELAEISPAVAVMAAWKILEASAKRLIARHGREPDYNVKTPLKLMQTVLVESELIDDKSARSFDKLRQLRNKVTHVDEYPITETDAGEYVELAMRLRRRLDAV